MSSVITRSWRTALILGGAALLAVWGIHRHAQRARLNFVVIQIDTLRADHVGCYGYQRPTTPTLDRFAQSGVQFRNAYSVTSWTMPAVASLLSGLTPARHGVRAPGDLLPDSIPTLAHELKENGYKTAAISANFLFVIPGATYPKPPLHFGQGFDTFEVLGQHADKDDPEAEAMLGGFVRTVRADVVTAKMTAFVRSSREPFFLFAAYIDPHYGYEPPPEYAKLFEPAPLGSGVTGFMHDIAQLAQPLSAQDLAHLTNLYDGEIRYVDQQVGEFLKALEDSGLADRTVVVILSDHGEAFLEHGRMLHGQDLYESLVRIPLLMRGPQIPRVAEDRLVSITDIMPTILELASLPVPPGLDGRSLLSAWREPPPQDHRSLVFELDNGAQLFNGPRVHARVLRQDQWKLIATLDGSAELYDIANDPGEAHDLAQAARSVLSRLSTALGQDAAGARAVAPRALLTDAEKDRLRALGYAVGPE